MRIIIVVVVVVVVRFTNRIYLFYLRPFSIVLQFVFADLERMFGGVWEIRRIFFFFFWIVSYRRIERNSIVRNSWITNVLLEGRFWRLWNIRAANDESTTSIKGLRTLLTSFYVYSQVLISRVQLYVVTYSFFLSFFSFCIFKIMRYRLYIIRWK